MATIHQRARALKLRFTQAQYRIIGLKVVEKFRESFEVNPPKVKVNLKSKRGIAFYWWCNDYEPAFFPVVDALLRESAQQIRERKVAGKKIRK